MQIDFHHAVTYVAARIAGFDHKKADIIAYAAQYVDDATNDGYITFENGSMYCHIGSAHKMLDYKNFDKLANHHAWIPFHFLPGNEGLPVGQGEDLEFVQKIICRPNSHIARDMVKECILRRNDSWGLHRLGITMHVYTDTWAHQGFAGIQHNINRVNDLRDADDNPDYKLIGWLKNYFGDKFDEKASSLVSDVLPLGHGAALSHPDKPFLKWSYTDDVGNKIMRDNPTDFLDAADNMCKAMQCYLAGDPEYKAPGMPEEGKTAIDTMPGYRRRSSSKSAKASRFHTYPKATVPGNTGPSERQRKRIPKMKNFRTHLLFSRPTGSSFTTLCKLIACLYCTTFCHVMESAQPKKSCSEE